MDLVMQISNRIYVLDFGKLIASGTPAEVQSNQRESSMHIWGWEAMLKIENLIVNYGGIEAVKGISWRSSTAPSSPWLVPMVPTKSTTLRSIVGLVKARSGSITLDGGNCWDRTPPRSFPRASPWYLRAACSRI